MMNLPEARTAEILEQEAGAELLIYDLRNSKTYLLNETSKNVFAACAARLTIDDLKRRYRYSDDLIHFAIDELRVNDLVESESTNHFAGLSRRDVIKRVGIGTLAALPVIAALTAPTAASAASACSPASGNNVQSGCPVGSQVSTGTSTCGGTPDSSRDNICNIFYRGQCQSGSARYAAGTCSNSGTGTLYSCSCA